MHPEPCGNGIDDVIQPLERAVCHRKPTILTQLIHNTLMLRAATIPDGN